MLQYYTCMKHGEHCGTGEQWEINFHLLTKRFIVYMPDVESVCSVLSVHQLPVITMTYKFNAEDYEHSCMHLMGKTLANKT